MTFEPQSPFGTAFGQRQVIVDLAPQPTRLLDRSDLGTLAVHCAVDPSAVADACSEALGVALPLEPGRAVQSGRVTALWLTPRSWLVQCPIEDEDTLAEAVNRRFPGKTAGAALYSDALAWLELDSPAAWDLLTEGAFVSLDRTGFAVGRVKRTPIAGMPTIVLRAGDTRWLLGVERSRARSFAARLGTMARTCAALAPA